MERMSGLDATFLYFELPTEAMNCTYLFRFGPTRTGAAVTTADIRARIESRLDGLPFSRRRMVNVPFGLHHPVWIEDRDFALDRHVRTIVLDPLAPPDALHDVVRDIARSTLDRRKPLWEMYVVEGAEGAITTAIWKFHHCVADGRAALALAEVLWGDADVPSRARPWRGEPIPTPARLLADAARDLRRDGVRVPALVRRTVRGVRGRSASPGDRLRQAAAGRVGAQSPHDRRTQLGLPVGRARRRQAAADRGRGRHRQRCTPDAARHGAARPLGSRTRCRPRR